MDDGSRLGEDVTTFVTDLTGQAVHDLPSSQASGADWLAVLRQWLARRHCGLVSIAHPQHFSWPGHWIGVVESPDAAEQPVAVLLFGIPSAVIACPAVPALVGTSLDEVRVREGWLIVPFQPFPSPVVHATGRVGEVVGIFVSPAKTEPMQSLAAATALAGRGLAGDRYAAKAGTFTPGSDRLRGYDLTLIESEVLEHLRLPDGSRLAAAESRRNLVTRGIDLNALVGREFTIGSVRAFGQRLCEPCAHLQRLTRPGVVAGLVHRGGLRADLLTDGEIRVGDRIAA
jgi:MOSC domain-containing protein YiiM